MAEPYRRMASELAHESVRGGACDAGRDDIHTRPERDLAGTRVDRCLTDSQDPGRAKQPSGQHEFDLLCESLGIDHRLTKPKAPQANGMVERFNGRIAQVLRSHRFNSGEDLRATLHRYVRLYNEHLPQKALDHQTPIRALKRWRDSDSQLFVRDVYNHSHINMYRPYGPKKRNLL